MTDISPDFNLVVTPAPVRNQIEDNLRRAILRGYFKPGQHLSDRMLCELLQVSRPVVREAVRMLTAEGLIETIPHKGAFVRSISAEEAAQIYELRAVLEALVAKSFVLRATDAQLQRLRDVYEELETGGSDLEHDSVLEIKRRFYDVLLDGAANHYLTEMFNRVISRSTLLRSSTLSVPGRLPSVREELRRLVDAIEARDADGAWQAALDYVRSAAAAITQVVAVTEAGTNATRQS